MIEPKEYEVIDNIKEEQFISNGFISRQGYYKYRRTLYGNTIFLTLLIEKDDNYMVINVSDNGGNTYSPFYNPDDRHNNLVYEDVVKTYNYFMDKLVEKKILRHKEEKTMGTVDASTVVTESTQTIKIKYHTDIDKIAMKDGGDWIDLRAAETVHMKKGDFKFISLGISMQLPKGYEAHIVPRSSTYKNFGIIQTNHQAVIDESYCGDGDIWRYPAYALKDTTINKNDRICQFRIVKKQPSIIFEEVKELGNKNRGGFGSTGKQ